jgi:hypothetical protein
MPMTPAVKTALAYTHICGFYPRNIHLHTWSEVNKRLLPGHPVKRVVDPVYLDEIADHPLMVGHARLIGEGYQVAQRYLDRRTSHYIEYDHPDHDDKAFVDRGGGGWYNRRIPNAGYRAESWT